MSLNVLTKDDIYDVERKKLNSFSKEELIERLLEKTDVEDIIKTSSEFEVGDIVIRMFYSDNNSPDYIDYEFESTYDICRIRDMNGKEVTLERLEEVCSDRSCNFSCGLVSIVHRGLSGGVIGTIVISMEDLCNYELYVNNRWYTKEVYDEYKALKLFPYKVGDIMFRKWCYAYNFYVITKVTSKFVHINRVRAIWKEVKVTMGYPYDKSDFELVDVTREKKLYGEEEKDIGYFYERYFKYNENNKHGYDIFNTSLCLMSSDANYDVIKKHESRK